MKTVKQVLVLGWVGVVALTALACSESPYSRSTKFCDCLNNSLNSPDAASGTLVYLQCRSFYDASLRELAPEDTTTFKNIADPAHGLFFVKVALKGWEKMADETAQNSY